MAIPQLTNANTIPQMMANLNAVVSLANLWDATPSNVASASTTDIGTPGVARVNITGTATIVSLGSSANRVVFVKFTGALVLTHNATSLILPTGANITTAAGDTAVFSSDASGNWTCVGYQRANGKALYLASADIVAALGFTPQAALGYTPANKAGDTFTGNVLAPNLIGGRSTGGTLDWNHSTNTQPGFAPSLLLGTATNGPGGAVYYHAWNIEYSSSDGSGNITQYAIPYSSPVGEMYMRGRYGGTWGSWVRFWSSYNFDPTTKQAASANLTSWSALAPSSKQDASANLSSWSALTPSTKQDYSANLASWSGIAPSSKQDASANLASWSAIATSTKQDYSANLASWAGIAPSAKQDALGFTPMNKAGDIMTGVFYSYAKNGTAATGDTGCARFQNSSGTGDSATAQVAFLCQGIYGINMHLRADGYFGIGGWSRSSWSWYSDPSGNMVAAGNITSYSDPRLKEDWEIIRDPLKIIGQINGGRFRWRHGFKHTEVKAGKLDYGIRADEVAAVMPEIVTDSIDIDGEVYQTVAYEKLVPVLLEAIKVLEARLRKLEE